jgi:hypothetical protein
MAFPPLVAAFLLVIGAGTARAQVVPNPAPGEPDFSVVVQGTFDPETLADFNRRVRDYEALRTRLEVGLPPLVVTVNPDEIEAFERRLAARIRDARGSRRGQIFAPAMEGQIVTMLGRHADRATIESMMDDGPREFDIDINRTYSKRHALATMSPKLLLLLPDLPRDIEYRFVGRHLILRDARANIIIDEIPYALKCRDCLPDPDADDDDDDDPDAAGDAIQATPR